MQIDVDLIQNHEVTATKLVIRVGGHTFETVGSAKKHPNDKHNSHLGQLLALSRALHHASIELNRAADTQSKIHLWRQTARRTRSDRIMEFWLQSHPAFDPPTFVCDDIHMFGGSS